MSNKERNRAAIGGIVGSSSGVRIEDCHSRGRIIVRGMVGSADVGGIAGRAKDTEILGSTSETEILYLPPPEVLDDIKKLMEDQIEEREMVADLRRHLQAMDESKDASSFRQAYHRFVESASNHIAVVAFVADTLKPWVSQST